MNVVCEIIQIAPLYANTKSAEHFQKRFFLVMHILVVDKTIVFLIVVFSVSMLGMHFDWLLYYHDLFAQSGFVRLKKPYHFNIHTKVSRN